MIIRDYPWPMMLVLALGVFVPTACVIWFMSEAMSNERLAVNQKVTELYQHRFEIVRQQYRNHWNEKLHSLETIDFERDSIQNSIKHNVKYSTKLFENIVLNNKASSVIVRDSSGNVIYPSHSIESDISMPSSWSQALKIEHVESNHKSAVKAYLDIASKTTNMTVKARAYMAMARSQIKLSQYQSALVTLTHTLAHSHFDNTEDSLGRLIQPNAQLRALQLIINLKGVDDSVVDEKLPYIPYWKLALNALTNRLVNYNDFYLKGNQRLFLMTQLNKLQVNDTIFSTIEAERLAARYLELGAASTSVGGLYETRLDGVLQYVTAQKDITVLYGREDILQEFNTLKPDLLIPEGVDVILIHPNTEIQAADMFDVVPVGAPLYGWQFGYTFVGDSPFGEAAKKQISVYLWTGILIILTILVLAIIVARFVGRQLRNSRLKKDLVDTVSHELKTPLSSMRVLVDTLLSGDHEYNGVTREYLELVSKENTRLIQLVDNFLTFSKIEKNKNSFDYQLEKPEEIANSALDTIREKFNSMEAYLKFDIEENLPKLVVDKNLLVTALTNLLENALKYSGESKIVQFHVGCKNDCIQFKVKDFGIGIAQNETGKIFDRFYRVDKRLSQDVDGCGLGLNIVDFVIKAHCGTINVISDVGVGSEFIVVLPIASSKDVESLLIPK